MASKGRQSSASLEVVRFKPQIDAVARLHCPQHLSDEEQAVWNEAINDQPAGSFTAVHSPLLEAYCRHIAHSRMIAEQLRRFDPEWLVDDDGLKRYDRLLAMHEREGRAASSLATRLRITRQAIDQQTVARTLVNAKKTRKPWEQSD